MSDWKDRPLALALTRGQISGINALPVMLEAVGPYALQKRLNGRLTIVAIRPFYPSLAPAVLMLVRPKGTNMTHSRLGRFCLASTVALTCVATLMGSFAARAETTLTAVMHSGLRSLDPNTNSAYIVRNYAYMVYDTLLARDANNDVRPEMADRWTVSDDGKVYTFFLRDGLKWHDGAPVTAEDCVASIRRWAGADKMGQIMMTLLSEMSVIDDKTFRLSFRVPTTIALTAFSKPSGVAVFMMPKRVAETPLTEQIKESIGSGPFKMVSSEFKPGIQVVFEKNKDYVPRKEPASGMAGGKVVQVDRVKWIAIPDAMTMINAMLSNEIDYIEYLPLDLLSMLESAPDVVITPTKKQGGQLMARFNSLQPPFNDKLLRQAALLAFDQTDILKAQIGNAKYYNTCAAFFGCGSRYESNTGADRVATGQIDKAAALLKQAKYDGTPVVLLAPTDVPQIAALPQVLAASLRKAGFNVQLQSMDWLTATVRRTSREPGSKGGWSLFGTGSGFGDIGEPVSFLAVAANGKDAWFGWPDVPAIEELRAKFARATSDSELKEIAEALQRELVEHATFAPLGEYVTVFARRKSIGPFLDTPVPVFWNVTKTGK